ncbi:protein-L-isoaspartate O-methyltransferase family protein [Bartonella sp. DGB2]|uniref:protein-L-isoaspartate O-methyltransferase family protein n=1 Tax=Bartonella sp. DGB2 TaxID=3388426 RepID=UPI00398FB761
MAIDFAELRRKMVDNQIRTVDVTKLPVLAAFLKTPREAFTPQPLKSLSYLDIDIQIKTGQGGALGRYMMRPASLAKLLQAADIKMSDAVLIIGANSGYGAALISYLAASVIALESETDLAAQSIETLKVQQCDNVAVVEGSLDQGYASEGPYDLVFFEGAVDFIPEAIFMQMKDGGRMISVEGHGNAGIARLYVKEGGVVAGQRLFNLAVPPLVGLLNASEFVF